MSAQPAAQAHVFPLVRHISRRLSKVLVRAPITPNQITGAGLAVGLACDGLLAVGGYGRNLVAAILLVVSYILDHSDGEVARAKGLVSEFGHKFDTFADWIVNAGFFFCLGIGVAAGTGERLWLWLGLAGAVGGTLNYIVWLVRHTRSGAPASQPSERHTTGPSGIWDSLLFAFRELTRADFCFIVLALALMDGLWLLLPAGAIGAQAYWLVALMKRTRDFHV